MDVGIALKPSLAANRSWDEVVGVAQRAAAAGFESLWLGDHECSAPRPRSPDPLVALAFVARRTAHLRLGTHAVSVSARPATVLAKALATLDVLARGRLVVGLRYDGANAAAPTNAPKPAGRLAEGIQVLRGMFGGGPFSFEGDTFRAVEARCLPVPLQRPAPPIWVVGTAADVVDVAARHADGWNVEWEAAPSDYAAAAARADDACLRAGRDPASLTRSVTLPVLGTTDRGHADLDQWAALGVSTLVLSPERWPALADLDTLATACRLG